MNIVRSVTDYVRGKLSEIRSSTLADDASGGFVLGVESVPDSLAGGLLAGVNPVAGLYGYLYGMLGGALFTGTSLMAVQSTSAMAIIVSERGLGDVDDPAKALVTLSVLTGVFMIVAGLLDLGKVFRLISRGVIAGFMSAIGVNIVLGQLSDFTGYKAEGSGRIIKTVDLLLHLDKIDLPTLTIGVATLVFVAVLSRSRLGAMGIVVGVVLSSALAQFGGSWFQSVAIVSDTARLPNRLPWPMLPSILDMPSYVLPALSLTFVGLIQGAGLAMTYPNPDGKPVPSSEDFYGQGVGNITAGLFQGIPVGGSISASALAVSAGARTRATYFFASLVMAVVLLFLSDVIGYVATPALAGLLIYIGLTSMHLRELRRVWRMGNIHSAVVAATFVLSIIIPIQYAVLLGAALSILLYIGKQANELIVRQVVVDDKGYLECDPPSTIGENEVIVLQHYGGLFFGTARSFEDQLPQVGARTKNSVMILRTRGVDEVGTTVAEMFHRVVDALNDADSKLVIVTNNDRFHLALEKAKVLDKMGSGNLYHGDEYLFHTTQKAYDEATAWVKDKTSEISR